MCSNRSYFVTQKLHKLFLMSLKTRLVLKFGNVAKISKADVCEKERKREIIVRERVGGGKGWEELWWECITLLNGQNKLASDLPALKNGTAHDFQ